MAPSAIPGCETKYVRIQRGRRRESRAEVVLHGFCGREANAPIEVSVAPTMGIDAAELLNASYTETYHA